MNLANKVEDISGESVLSCYQCGLCSGFCPLRFTMDLSPTQVIRLIQLGNIEKILSSNTYWICSTCFNCYVGCPRGINITKIMEALRQIKLREGEDKMNLKTIEREELRKIPPIALISNLRKTTS